MDNINSYEELKFLIESKTNGVNNLLLEISDVCFNFDLQLEWIDFTLRGDFDQSKEIRINFTNCEFKIFDCSNMSETSNTEVNIVGGAIENLNIINSIFVGKFYINKQYGNNKKEIKIGELKICDSKFKENFKLHNARVNIFSVEDTDFEKHADFFKSTFMSGVFPEGKDENVAENDICFKAINFRGLALFGDTKFERKLIFKYVTFESYSHFRRARLEKGLDLDYSNIQNEMNFFDVQHLDTKEAKNNTSQETYRIIKNNFEKIGNKIEANKYLALELEQKKIALKSEVPRQWLDYLVFEAH